MVVISTINVREVNEIHYLEWRLQYFAGGITKHLQALPSALLPAHGTSLTAFTWAFAVLRLLASVFPDKSNKGLSRNYVNKKCPIRDRP
jgi:hypothetical protein